MRQIQYDIPNNFLLELQSLAKDFKKIIHIHEKEFVKLEFSEIDLYFFAYDRSWYNESAQMWIGKYYLNSYLADFYLNFLIKGNEISLYRYILNLYAESNTGMFDMSLKHVRNNRMNTKFDLRLPNSFQFVKIDYYLRYSKENEDLNRGFNSLIDSFRLNCLKHNLHISEWKRNEIQKSITQKNNLSIFKKMVDHFLFKEYNSKLELELTQLEKIKEVLKYKGFIDNEYNWECSICKSLEEEQIKYINNLGKACPNCLIKIKKNYCPNCGEKAVIPNYCNNCKMKVDTNYCEACGLKITNLNNNF
jgi:hypothetical protein